MYFSVLWEIKATLFAAVVPDASLCSALAAECLLLTIPLNISPVDPFFVILFWFHVSPFVLKTDLKEFGLCSLETWLLFNLTFFQCLVLLSTILCLF
jgi:hypothetical protein